MDGVRRIGWKKAIAILIALVLTVTLVIIYPGLHQSGVDRELREAVLHQDEARAHAALLDGANARGFAWVPVDRGPMARLLNGENPFREGRRPPALDQRISRSNHLRNTLLMYAADTGNDAIARELLDHGAEVDSRMANGNTALFVCAGRRSELCLDELIRHGAAVNAINDDGLTPLHIAARSDNESIIGQLLAHGADPKIKDKKGQTPLAVAAEAHSANACLLLLDWGANAADLLRPSSNSQGAGDSSSLKYPDENESLLAWAASKGSMELVKRAWDRILPAGERARQAPEALYQAVTARYRSVADYLLTKGVSPNVQVKVARKQVAQISAPPSTSVAVGMPVLFGPRGPVHEVSSAASLVRAQRMQPVRLQATTSAAATDPVPNARFAVLTSPLSRACQNNDLRMIELLLKHGASAATDSGNGYAPLMAAAPWPQIVDLLISKGANVHERNPSGQTALMVACDSLSPSADRLVAAGSDVNAADKSGATPLIHAVRYHSVFESARLVQVLVQHKAKADARDKQGKTALDYAREFQNSTAGQASASSNSVSNPNKITAVDILSNALAKARP